MIISWEQIVRAKPGPKTNPSVDKVPHIKLSFTSASKPLTKKSKILKELCLDRSGDFSLYICYDIIFNKLVYK